MIVEDILQDNKVILRSISIDDCNDEYVSWLKNPRINKFLETRWQEQNIDTVKEFVKNQIDSKNSYLFAILYDVGDGIKKHIGNIKIGPINYHYNNCELSYFIGNENYHGKGIASKSINLLSNYAFLKLNIHRIQATLFDENIDSKKTLENSGFKYEGKYHEKAISPVTNEYCDVLIYYKLSSWERL